MKPKSVRDALRKSITTRPKRDQVKSLFKQIRERSRTRRELRGKRLRRRRAALAFSAGVLSLNTAATLPQQQPDYAASSAMAADREDRSEPQAAPAAAAEEVTFSRRSVMGALAAVPMAGMAPDTALTRPDWLQEFPDMQFGTAVQPEHLHRNHTLEPIIRRECGLLTPEFHGQWSAVEWQRGKPWFGNYDLIVGYARTWNKQVRGHSLIWEQMTPQWARDEMRDRRDWRTVARHFGNLVKRYRGKVAEWIVVNEMIDTEDGDRGIRRNSFQQAFGNSYVERALVTAREFDPEARLIINDYSLEHDNPVDARRRTALLRLVEDLKGRGVPLDVVGLQGHIELAKGRIAQQELRNFLADLRATGVEVAITELDVLEADRTLPLETRDAEVADAVASLLEVANSDNGVTSVVTWGMDDRTSWLQEREQITLAAAQDAGFDPVHLNRGLPLDARMQTKPMWDVISEQLA